MGRTIAKTMAMIEPRKALPASMKTTRASSPCLRFLRWNTRAISRPARSPKKTHVVLMGRF